MKIGDWRGIPQVHKTLIFTEQKQATNIRCHKGLTSFTLSPYPSFCPQLFLCCLSQLWNMTFFLRFPLLTILKCIALLKNVNYLLVTEKEINKYWKLEINVASQTALWRETELTISHVLFLFQFINPQMHTSDIKASTFTCSTYYRASTAVFETRVFSYMHWDWNNESLTGYSLIGRLNATTQQINIQYIYQLF